MKIRIKRGLTDTIDYILVLFLADSIFKFVDLFLIHSENNIKRILILLTGEFLFIIFCISKKDCLSKKYSLGKQIFKLGIVDEKGDLVTDKKILTSRNIENLIFVGIYWIMILASNDSVGDNFYKTKIVELDKM